MSETSRTNLLFRIIWWAFLIHVILIAMTIVEVFLYSTFINSGQDNALYEQHAQVSGPYIGIIAGFMVVYAVGVRLAKRNPSEFRLVALGVPAAYIVMDFIIVVLTVSDFIGNGWIFGVSYVTKLIAGYLVILTLRKHRP